MFFYIVVCFYIKVEESFNIQVIYDVLYYRFDIEKVNNRFYIYII